MAEISAIFSALGGTAAMVGVFGLVARSIFTRVLEKDMESFKASLGAEAARDLELYRAKLARTATEFQIKLTALQAKRSEALAELYRLLVDAKDSVLTDATLLAHIGAPMGGSVRDSLAKCRLATECIRRNQLYLTKETAQLVQRIVSSLDEPLRGYWIAAERAVPSFDEPKAAAALAELGTYDVGQVFDDALARIEQEFRGMLGVDQRSD